MNKEVCDDLSKVIRICKDLQAFERLGGIPVEEKERKLADIIFLCDDIESAWGE